MVLWAAWVQIPPPAPIREQRKEPHVMSDSASRSINGVPIRLPDERWAHIIGRHPELAHYRRHVIETVTNPDLVAKGLHGKFKAARLYAHLPMGPRYFIVLCKEVKPNDGFIITARISSDVGNVIRRGIIWQRK